MSAGHTLTAVHPISRRLEQARQYPLATCHADASTRTAQYGDVAGNPNNPLPPWLRVSDAPAHRIGTGLYHDRSVGVLMQPSAQPRAHL